MTSRPEDMPRSYEPIYDKDLQEGLKKLTLEELRHLSKISGTTANSGFLLAHSDEATREDFIEELSEVGDKTEPQITTIRNFLNQ